MTKQDKDVTTMLKEAVEAIEAAEVPKELREVAFARILDYQFRTTSGRKKPPESPAENGDAPGTPSPDDDAIATIAARLGSHAADVARVLEVDEEGVHLIMAASDLSSNKQDAMGEVAFLVSAARQAIGLEDFTSAGLVRDAADVRGVLDSGNFWKAMGKIDGKGVRIRGTGIKRDFKVNQRGYEAAAKIIARIAGGESP